MASYSVSGEFSVLGYSFVSVNSGGHLPHQEEAR